MYVPKHFEESRVDVLHALIRKYPLATVVTYSSNGLNANHIPLHLSESPVPYGMLRGHIAAANPMLGELTHQTESLVIFHGPSAYITPSWYATKNTTGKVVPTWNYAVVHAHGILRRIDDTAWLREQIQSLTTQLESQFADPWSPSDAPPEYIDKLIGGIVGIEMVITKMVGKWKVSQNQPSENLISVIDGLQSDESYGSPAMATLVSDTMKQQR